MSLRSHSLTTREGVQVDAQVGLTACDMTACMSPAQRRLCHQNPTMNSLCSNPWGDLSEVQPGAGKMFWEDSPPCPSGLSPAVIGPY